MNLTDYGVIGGIVSVIFGAVWKIISLIVKPIKDTIDGHDDELRRMDTQVEILINAEDKNAMALIDQSNRIGRIDDRVVAADLKSSENDKKIVELTMKQDQFGKEKTKLFDKTDALEKECSEIKIEIAGKMK